MKADAQKLPFTVRLEPQHREALRLLAVQYGVMLKRPVTVGEVVRTLIEQAPLRKGK